MKNKSAAIIRKYYGDFVVLDREGEEVGWWRTLEGAKEHQEILNKIYEEEENGQ
jgi:hypothetical protein